MLTLVLVLANATAPIDLPRQWAQFSRAGALNHVSERVDIATGERTGSKDFPYKLRLTRQRLDEAPEIAWAESASCPAIPALIADMPNIKMPSPAPHGLPDQPVMITLDGATYTLSAPSSDAMGKLTISSNIGSPLAAWVDAAFTTLKPCWQPAAR